ncbi:short-chain dehydrogenase [Micromonospora echinospora]|uniref:NAD(P)-dependent dehydrogenase, short-chain alcohol dehydrogenase family n=1 Tax=Micromonospora echinospora TaxID=1877 RepID=A0A1C4YV64_MICEC|nr:SDR family NAD(P)-dependent oxidoreductase [Micromonospora echinospora]OZV74561.1 short-chain dehydrogenase [Micromonospora echinospora]SCF24652.1 NAD(P)-dependent dehydrogenase, short-chain alcohol dehydrogenase family [Micromonospora echinospora]
MSEIRLDGRVAIVTGAGRGLGREHALLLAGRGAQVVVNDVGDGDASGASPAQQVVDEIRAAGGAAVVDDTEVGTAEGADRIVDRATSTYGRLDILVNNAGILRDRSFAKMSAQEYEAVMQVHVGGTFWMSQAAWPVMTGQGYGRIVNTTSAAGLFGNFGQVNYAAAKAAIIGITRTLAIEGARSGIRVNAIEPGARTRMTENLLGDLADSLDPALVAPLVLWLGAQECEATGEVYNVGGGRVARVVVAQTRGLFARDLTGEQVRDAWTEINDESTATVVTDFRQEMAILTDLLGR